MALAYQCFRLALASQNDHPEAYNNLGVLEMRKGHNDQVGVLCLLQENRVSRVNVWMYIVFMLQVHDICQYILQLM